jgi:hypothetical protein
MSGFIRTKRSAQTPAATFPRNLVIKEQQKQISLAQSEITSPVNGPTSATPPQGTNRIARAGPVG